MAIKKETLSVTFPRVSGEDHIILQFNDWIVHPLIPGIWSQTYAENVIAHLFQEYPSRGNNDKFRASSQLILSPGWDSGLDTTILNDIHLAEASAREISPWTLQKVLMMEENLYRNGHLRQGSDLFSERSKILSWLGDVGSKGDLEVVGQKVCGLSLCVNEVYLLNQFSPDLAKKMLDDVTKKHGATLYQSEVISFLANRDKNVPLSQQICQDIRQISIEAQETQRQIIKSLPEDVKLAVGRKYTQDSRAALRISYAEMFDDIKYKVGNLIRRIKG